jgi:hypothetical protein
MTDEKRTLDEPHDRLTRMANRILDGFEADPEFREGDKVIAMLFDSERGGIGMRGYEDVEHGDSEALVDLFLHLQAIFRANGKDLQLHALGQG